MARSGERAKPVKALAPGDRVRILLGGFASIVSIKPSARTMVRRAKAGPREPEAVGLIVLYELVDGPKIGTRADMILHPDDEVRIT